MEDENLKRCYALALSIVEKSAVKYLEEQSDENHRNLLFNLGNTGMMAFSQGDEFFNEFMDWMKNFRAKVQGKSK